MTAKRKSASVPLPDRWFKLDPITAQLRYAQSLHRFNIVPAGRRGGKTEHAKRRLARAALNVGALSHNFTPRFFAAAPTQLQAKRIFWRDLCDLLKPYIIKTMISELTLTLVTGSEVVVTGLDKPARVEGQPWDGGVVDEIANCPPDAWQSNLRPALSTRGRLGWCDLIGVPEGRNFYHKLYLDARAEMKERGARSQWGAYTWFSSEVLPASEIEAARADLDALTFAQEYEASFVSFTGGAYHAFSEAGNVQRVRQYYNSRAPLALCFDFNVSPGVACVVQEIGHEDARPQRRVLQGLLALEASRDTARDAETPAVAQARATAVLGEVWIPNNSTTTLVVNKLISDWGEHQGIVTVYGDASGGARGTAQTQGSDWDIVREMLYAHFGADRVDFRVPLANPSERSRVNALNTRLCSGDGTRRLLVDGAKAPHVVLDLEGVQVVQGGSGEIDKKKDRLLTHISDALGYYVVKEYPINEQDIVVTDLTL